ncbi:hypothetical protein [Rugosimonospora africana]|uniref:Uncharacterized protein n=1 Tax=Rugosimonospora africana TaxID=556532 RepID=A0A8J3VP78_9ACTN|nr:hypothetical protein [Rugosimonospora africana]GIH13677.1 hypothetical protein Raf01_18490 [Rugosimonospora africana]
MVRVLVLALLALVGALFPSFSPAANLYVLVVGGTLAWLALSGRLARRALAGPLPATTPAPVLVEAPLPVEAPVPVEAPMFTPTTPTTPVAAGPGPAAREASSRLSPAAAWWLVPVLLLGVVELTDLALGSTYPHPTLSNLLDPVLDHYPVRAAAYFGWLAAFWWLVRR